MKTSLVTLATTSFLLLTGCQGAVTVQRPVETATQTQTGSPDETNGAQDTVSDADEDGGLYQLGATSNDGAPPYSFRVEGIGYTGMKVKVKANKKLRIRFEPGRQDQTVEGTGFSPEYSQLAVFIKVENTEKATPLLSNGITRAATTKVLDFSSAFTKTCPSTSTTCRQDVEITVYRPNYDHYCYVYGMYCPHTQVYKTHPWNGTISVETDDTSSVD